MNKDRIPELPTLTAVVTVIEARYYCHSNGSSLFDSNTGELTVQDSEELQVQCAVTCSASGFGEDFEVELYFCDHDEIEKVRCDLAEGSQWFVSGLFSIIESKISLYDPSYRELKDEDFEVG